MEAKQGEHAWLEVSRASGPRLFKQENAKTEAAGDPTASPTYKKILSVLSRRRFRDVSKIGVHNLDSA